MRDSEQLSKFCHQIIDGTFDDNKTQLVSQVTSG